MLFLDSTHHHAQMPRFADHTDALWLDDFLNGFGDLGCQALLNLQPPREDFHQSGQLAESDDLSVRNVSDVYLPEERQHVMLAEAEHLDIFDYDHLVIVHGEQGA